MSRARWPIRRITPDRAATDAPEPYLARIPAVTALLADGLELGAATVLVGENGSGKSTLVEAIALAYGMSAEGGSTGAMHSTRATESALSRQLTLVRNPGASRWGFFLRAETMHGFYSYLEANPPGPASPPDPKFHEVSHGESFLEILRHRFTSPGLYVLDEPESALSFTGCLALLDVLTRLLSTGRSQVVMSTHSPILAALPGAEVVEIGPWGMRRSEWADLDLVANWRTFLDDPQAYLRHLPG